MKDYIISVMEKHNISPKFYFDKLRLLGMKSSTVSVAYLEANGICYKATVTNKFDICWEINLSSAKESLLTLDFFNYEECMESFALIVGEESCKVLNDEIKAVHWREQLISEKKKSDTVSTGAPDSKNNTDTLNYDRL